MTKEETAKLNFVKWIMSASANKILYFDATSRQVSMSVIGSSIFTIGTFNDEIFIGIHHSMAEWWFDLRWVRIECIPDENRLHLIAEMTPGNYLTLVIHDERGAGECIQAWHEEDDRWRIPFRVFKMSTKRIKGASVSKKDYLISHEIGIRLPVKVIYKREKATETPEWMRRAGIASS